MVTCAGSSAAGCALDAGRRRAAAAARPGGRHAGDAFWHDLPRVRRHKTRVAPPAGSAVAQSGSARDVDLWCEVLCGGHYSDRALSMDGSRPIARGEWFLVAVTVCGGATRRAGSGTYGSEFFGLIPATLHGPRTSRAAQGSVDSDLLACEAPEMRLV
eukprot:4663617-Prymnesium_polylepis.1